MRDVLGRAHRERAGLTNRQCAGTNRQGNPCGRKCEPGHVVCHLHGARTPQAERLARERLSLLIEPALEVLHRALHAEGPPDAVAVRAAQLVLDRAGLGPRATLELAQVPEDSAWLSWLTDDELDEQVRLFERHRARALARMEVGGPRPSDVTVIDVPVSSALSRSGLQPSADPERTEE